MNTIHFETLPKFIWPKIPAACTWCCQASGSKDTESKSRDAKRNTANGK